MNLWPILRVHNCPLYSSHSSSCRFISMCRQRSSPGNSRRRPLFQFLFNHFALCWVPCVILPGEGRVCRVLSIRMIFTKTKWSAVVVKWLGYSSQELVYLCKMLCLDWQQHCLFAKVFVPRVQKNKLDQGSSSEHHVKANQITTLCWATESGTLWFNQRMLAGGSISLKCEIKVKRPELPILQCHVISCFTLRYSRSLKLSWLSWNWDVSFLDQARYSHQGAKTNHCIAALKASKPPFPAG